MEFQKSDWKLFRQKIVSWQESYMESLINEYIILLDKNLPASSKFWELEKRIVLDRKKPGVILNLRKQQMIYDIVRLINDGAITLDDLVDFSDELRDTVKYMLKG
jgi:hypothetical protein